MWSGYSQSSPKGVFNKISGYCCGTRWRLEAGRSVTIKGVATSCAGAPLPGAKVTATVSVDTGQSKSATVTAGPGGAFSATVTVPYANPTQQWKLGYNCHKYNLGSVKLTAGSASWSDPIYVFQYGVYCP